MRVKTVVINVPFEKLDAFIREHADIPEGAELARIVVPQLTQAIVQFCYLTPSETDFMGICVPYEDGLTR